MLKWKIQVLAADLGELREQLADLEGRLHQAIHEVPHDGNAEQLAQRLSTVAGKLDACMPIVTSIRED